MADPQAIVSTIAVMQGDAWSLSGHVFTTEKGTPLDTRNVTRYFQLAIRRAGLPHQRFHDLRHAAATVLIEQGIDLSIVSRMLGHADLATTADVHAHLTDRMLQKGAEGMEAALGSREAEVHRLTSLQRVE
jgi:integrase